MHKNNGEIFLDLDRNRIKIILSETYNVCKDQLGVDFSVSREDFVSKINPYLDSNRVAIPVFIGLPSRSYPELAIEVNLRRKKVFVRMANKKKQANLNYYLNAL